MKIINALLLFFLALSFASCQVIGSIFGAGIYVGVFISVLFVALIIYIVSRISRKD